MSNTVIVTLMTNLINKRYYDTAEEAIGKLDVYFAMDRITEADYSDLVMLAQSVYAPPAVEPEIPTEPEMPTE